MPSAAIDDTTKFPITGEFFDNSKYISTKPHKRNTKKMDKQ